MVADALDLLAQAPTRFGGLWLRARSGPARDAVLQGVRARFPTAHRITPATDEAALFGALDVVATLAEGREVRRAGLVRPEAVLILTMAERTAPALCARLGVALETGALGAVIALDEGEADEALHPALADRLTLCLSLDGARPSAVPPPEFGEPAVLTEDGIARLTALADDLGVPGLRAPIAAVAAAQHLAGRKQRTTTIEEDLVRAAELILIPRATRLPSHVEDLEEDGPAPPEPGEDASKSGGEVEVPQDVLLDAARAALPPDLLAQLAARRARGAQGAGAGARRQGNRRGRPLPARPGRPGAGDRLDLVATLRAAAPWQTIRRRTQPDGPPVLLRPSDLRLRRFEERSDRVLIFGVDASGSTALARLAEAKGAVELLLAEAYARRDHVALVAFRGARAEVMLSPTRALVAAKRGLQGLVGGGGTPLASGLQEMARLAAHAGRSGQSPALVLLTDGKGNIALDGSAGRATARQDVEITSRRISAEGWPILLIDTAHRPQAAARDLAGALGGIYLALPRADARGVMQAVTSGLTL